MLSQLGAACLSQAGDLYEAGLLFTALGMNHSQANRAQVRTMLEQATNSGVRLLRARALLALGTTYSDERDYSRAVAFYQRAARVCAHPEIVFHTRNNLAYILGHEYNSSASFDILQSNLPLAARLGKPHVAITLNNLACDLLSFSRLDEAARAFQPVAASPFFQNFPEWRETREQIAREQQARERAANVVDLGAARLDQCGQYRGEIVRIIYGAQMTARRLRKIRDFAARVGGQPCR